MQTINAMLLLAALSPGAVDIVVGPQICEAERPLDARAVQWKEQWLINTSSTDEADIVCPVPRSLASDSLSVTLSFVGQSSQNRTVACTFTEYRPDGVVVDRNGRSLTTAEGVARSLGLAGYQFESLASQLSVSCTLPPETALTRLLFTVDTL